MQQKTLLPLRLQLFAEDVSAEIEADKVDETEETTEATFTQADIDKAIAERLKRETRKADKTIKELQSEVETLKNGDKPQEEQLGTLQATVEEKEKENARLNLQLEAMKAGVQADKLEKFIKLATLSDAEDFADKVEETLNDFPEFGTLVEKEELKKKIVAGGNPNGKGMTMTKKDIMAIKDPVERVEQITKNSHLF